MNGLIVRGLLLRKLWAYHATFVVLTLFIAYQFYRYNYTHDIGLIVISIIDLIVMLTPPPTAEISPIEARPRAHTRRGVNLVNLGHLDTAR